MAVGVGAGGAQAYLEGRPVKGTPVTPLSHQTPTSQQPLQPPGPLLRSSVSWWPRRFPTLPPAGTKPFCSKEKLVMGDPFLLDTSRNYLLSLRLPPKGPHERNNVQALVTFQMYEKLYLKIMCRNEYRLH